jgi:Domain of unknown function (DUF1990)
MDRTRDQDLLLRVSDLALTYPEVGATAGAKLPAGYRIIERSLSLGSGFEIFERASAGLLSWQMHRRAGIIVSATSPTAITGTDALLVLGRRPFTITAPCRVVYDVATDRRCQPGIRHHAAVSHGPHPITARRPHASSRRSGARAPAQLRPGGDPSAVAEGVTGPAAHGAAHVHRDDDVARGGRVPGRPAEFTVGARSVPGVALMYLPRASGSGQPICSARATMMPAGPRR